MQQISAKQIFYKVTSNPEGFLESHSSQMEGYNRLCEEADIYVMSGGGYVNPWVESLVSKFAEIAVAKKRGLKCLMVGQTIGPWTNKESERLGRLLCSKADGAFFRDADSVQDMRRWKLGCVDAAIPDIALADCRNFQKRPQVAFVPFSLHTDDVINKISENLIKISEHYGHEIVIMPSQLWETPFRTCMSYFFLLQSRHANVRLAIPRNVEQLQVLLGESSLCISENLHGLILAYRASTPVICINDGRKHKGFMQLIGQERALIPLQSVNSENIYNASDAALKTSSYKQFREIVYGKFAELTADW